MSDEFAELIDGRYLGRDQHGACRRTRVLAASDDWTKVEAWLVTLPAVKRGRAREILLREGWSHVPTRGNGVSHCGWPLVMCTDKPSSTR